MAQIRGGELVQKVLKGRGQVHFWYPWRTHLSDDGILRGKRY